VLRRRAIVVPAVLSLFAGGGAVAWASAGSSTSGYRTARVSTGDVQQLLDLTGSVSAVEQAKVRFRTAGTVSAVRVSVGQAVRKGAVLATLDSGPLQDAVTKATAGLAKAKATLESDSVSSSTDVATTSGAAAQAAATRALQEAQRALGVATAACAATPAPTPPPTPTPAPWVTRPAPTAPARPTRTALRSTSAPSPGSDSPSCAEALLASLHAQQAAGRAQQQLAQALAKSGPAQGTGNGRAAGGSTAAKITLDTAAVSAAEVALAEAQKDLAAVSLVAPITGTVATVPWTAGSRAAVGDSLVILGTGPVDVTVDVPSASIRSVKAGLPVTVRADGGTRTLDGVVSRVGLLPTSSSSSAGASTTTYPVVIGLAAGAGLVDGSSAAVSIVLKTVHHVLTVPNSALRGATVEVLSAGKASTVRVQTGAVGALVTQVTSGLSLGQTVVLADLGEALPTSSTTNNGGANRFGGVTGTPGGFGAGRAVVRRN
jgi:HlyD family secretion protein